MEQDSRFSHIATDPKFRRVPKAARKVKIDKRFQSMFKDKKFKVKYTVDKRGRPVSHTSTEDLKRYYDLSSGSDEDSISDNETTESVPGKFVRAPSSSGSDNDSDEVLNEKQEGDKEVSDKIKQRLKNLSVDYARGEAALVSESSSDDEESEEEESEGEGIEHAWGELDRDAERTEEITCRLAACNMDWDRIRALDLMVLFNSFLPSGGVINSVKIYPSEYGLKRMKEEEIKGPIELVERSQNGEENEDDNEEGSKYHMEKLRQYQLNRLKYYYAVIECDRIETANKLYTECDGLEYESSATKIDLRFIPDDMEFDHEPKEICDQIPEQGKYLPRFFTTTALQQAKVDLTWDETAPERIELTQKLNSGKIDDIADADLQAYLATSSEEESENEDINEEEEDDDQKPKGSTIDKYKALLQDIEQQEAEKNNKDVEMEITWGINLKEKTDKLVKQKLEEKTERTPFEQFLEKRKEKKKAKREERKNKRPENDEDSENDSDIPSDIDMNDPYFAEEFNKPEFKQKKKNTKNISKDSDSETDEQKKAELELLLSNDKDDDKKHFSLKKIQENENESKSKKKRKLKKNEEQNDIEDDFQININDRRFSALYSSHHYNVDPTDPHFKKTKAMDAIISEKIKRRNESADDIEPKKLKSSSNKERSELNVLVKSIKRKTEAFKNKSK